MRQHVRTKIGTNERLDERLICFFLVTQLVFHVNHFDYFTNKHQAANERRIALNRTDLEKSSRRLRIWSSKAKAKDYIRNFEIKKLLGLF